jgi:hypothetical protein
VDRSWIRCGVPWIEKKLSRDFARSRRDRRVCIELRLFLRLIRSVGRLEYRFVLWVLPALTTTAHRFVQQINGRDYRIEVIQLAAHRWRAQVLNAYGGPTALMPFYDATPDEALQRLADWLARAHRSVTNS